MNRSARLPFHSSSVWTWRLVMLAVASGLFRPLSAGEASSPGAADPGHAVFAAAQLEMLWNKGEFTEGVAVRSDGMVFFSDIHTDPKASGQILMFQPLTRKTIVYSQASGKSNGLAFDTGDRLWACCGANGGLRALCLVDESGDPRPVVAEYQNKALNAPNDLLIHPDGSIYFSDPRYLGPEPMSLDGMWVFRFEPDSGTLTVATRALRKPNGIEVSPDGRTLYVAETDNGFAGLPGEVQGPPGQMLLTAFNVAEDGSLSNRRVLTDFGKETGIDGMAVDDRGRIFAAVRAASRFGIGVYDPSGRELDFLKTEALPTNCAFGVGNDSDTLYVTAGGGLYQVKIRR